MLNMMRIRLYRSLLPASLTLVLLPLVLISCGGTSSSPIDSSHDGPPTQTVDVSQIPDAVPKKTKRSRSGNPTSYVVFGKRYHVMSSSHGYKKRGIASWYGSKFHGRRTSSGEPYDMHAMTAAHKTLPLPTYVRVTNLKNGRQVILKVNDRGPFHDNRIIDLSHTAAIKLGIKGTGTGLVEVEAIDTNETYAAAKPSMTTSTLTKPALKTPALKTQRTAPSSVDLYLQLGAFVSSHNANNLKNRVNSVIDSNTASISTTLKNQQQFYRVRIGPINGVAQADELAHTLTQKGFSQPRVIIE